MPISGMARMAPSRKTWPVAVGAGEDGRGDPVLFEDDVALDRGRGTVFLVFFDAIGTRCAWAEDFEDDDGIGDNRARIWAGGADDEAVRITIFRSHPRKLPGVPRNLSVRETARLRWTVACAGVPPVIATGWKPSNS